MAFKLRYNNVIRPGVSSPIKQADQSLIMGAGQAAKSFVDPLAAMQGGMGIGTTEAAEAEGEAKSCIEQGLTGMKLKECQNKNEPIDPCEGKEGSEHQECRDAEHDKIDAAEAARIEGEKKKCADVGRAWDERKGVCGKPLETTQ